MTSSLLLILAGYDPSGHAGVLLDQCVAQAFGVDACTVVTADTTQAPGAPVTVTPWEADLIEAQVLSVLDGRVPSAVKIGMVPDSAVAGAISTLIDSGALGPVIVHDPVLATSSGWPLWIDGDDISALLDLSRRSTLVTPNTAEAARYAGYGPDAVASAKELARSVSSRLGTRTDGAVLIKGGHQGAGAQGRTGHGAGDVIDTLYLAAERKFMEHRAVRRPVEIRGTGCFLSTAIASLVAQGVNVAEAVGSAHGLVRTIFDEAAAHICSDVYPDHFMQTAVDTESEQALIDCGLALDEGVSVTIPTAPGARWMQEAALLAGRAGRPGGYV